MGCGASTGRPPSVPALNPGELRDRSLQDDVELHEGVAKAAAINTNPFADGKVQSNPEVVSLPPPKPAPRPPSAATTSAQPGPGPASRTPSSKLSRPASGTSNSPITAPTSPAPATKAPGDAGPASRTPSSKLSRPASGTSNNPITAPTSPAPATKAAGDAADVSQKPSVLSKPPEEAAQKPPGPATSPLSDPAPTLQQAPPQPRMVDCAVSLQFLTDFCATVPEDMPTWKVVTDVIVPATRDRRCRYVELLQPGQVGRCDYFISHRWATPFSHLVRYVRKHLVELGDVRERQQEEQQRAGEGAAGAEGRKEASEFEGPTRMADQVFVWCDIFAINQHPGQVQADDLAQLKDCVVTSHQTLLCLDDKGLVLTRIWCLYEIWNTVLAGGPPKLAVLGYDVNQDAFTEVYITLDVAEAQATVESDRVRILADIAASTGLQELNLVIKNSLVESTHAEAENAQKALLPRAKNWQDYQRIIEAINKHIQMLVALGRTQESQRYGYLVQRVSTAWQKSSKTTTTAATAAPTPSKAAGAKGPAGDGAAGGAGGSKGAGAAGRKGGNAAEEEEGATGTEKWHWSQYPRDQALRQIVDRAAAAEKSVRMDIAMALFREAVSKAQERVKQVGGQKAAAPKAASSATPSPAAACALDLAGCQMRLGVFLFSQGFMEQASSEGGEPAARAFEQHCGPGSLTYASAAYQLAVLAKNDWQLNDRRKEVLAAALKVQEAQLGPRHAVTLATFREQAELIYNAGDYPSGVKLFHELCVRLSDGVDLAAATIAGAKGSPAAKKELRDSAIETWSQLTSYMAHLPGSEDDGIRVCRALVPHNRKKQARLMYDAAVPGGEYQEEALAELKRLGLPPQPPAPGAGLPARAFPPEFLDPDNVRYDTVANAGELTNWSMILAKKGRLQDAVRVQWRIGDVYRTNKTLATTEITLPSGKITMPEAHDRGLMLDMSVPGVAKVAAKMLAKERPHLLKPASTAGAAPGTAGAAAREDAGAGAEADAGAGAGAGADPAEAAYDGPGYIELITQMSKLWGDQDYKGAEAACRQIVRCQTSVHGPGSKEVVDALVQLATLLQSAGRLKEAVAEARHALALHEKILNGKDPTMASTLQALANMLKDRAEGEKLHRRAVALVEKVYGPDHTHVGQALVLLGSHIMHDVERFKEGQDIMQRGIDLQNKFQENQAAMTRAF